MLPTPPEAALMTTVSPGPGATATTAAWADLPGEVLRLGDELVVGDGDVFGVAGTLPGPAEDVVADLPPCDVGAGLHDGAGQVAALSGGEGRREALVQGTGADLGLARVDARGAHLDQHVVRSEGWWFGVFDAEHLDASVVVESYGSHGSLLVFSALCGGRCRAGRGRPSVDATASPVCRPSVS
jgi:hypothetical protein